MKLAIIGTAGRKEDGDKMANDPSYWRTMCAVSQIVTTILKPTCVVSGDAAYADHTAVWLYLQGMVPNLSLHFPAEWKGESSHFDRTHDGNIANHYHSLFSHAQKLDSLAQIQEAILKGATVHVNPVGFKARNTDVANEADSLLPFTFGAGGKVKDGGTADTVEKFLEKRVAEQKRLYAANMNGGDYVVEAFPAYHFCLNTLRLYSL